MECYHEQTVSSVSDMEHIAFLALWLSKCIFCCRSLKVAKRFIALANQLHEGRDICLNELVLGSLYKSLGEGVMIMTTLKPTVRYLITGPFWILQLWLNATFEKALKLSNPKYQDVTLQNRTIEGTHLALMTLSYSDLHLETDLKQYILMFARVIRSHLIWPLCPQTTWP